MWQKLSRVAEAMGLLSLCYPIVVLVLLTGYDPLLAGTLLGWYVMAFVAVAARYSWGRPFAIGLSAWGITVMYLLGKATGWPSTVVHMMVAHALVPVALIAGR